MLRALRSRALCTARALDATRPSAQRASHDATPIGYGVLQEVRPLIDARADSATIAAASLSVVRARMRARR